MSAGKFTGDRMTRAIDVHNVDGLEGLRKSVGADPEVVRRLRNRLLKRFLPDENAVEDLGLASSLQLHSLELFQRCDSEQDGASRLLFRTQNGLLLESVILRIASGRSTLCVSSQVGCAAACDFCATGKMGIARSLAPSEILDQVVQCGQILQAEGRRLRNIVFMGMGEPFHNEDGLWQTIETLISTAQFDRPPGSILVSTVGLPEPMVRFATEFPGVNMALSLHSANQATREQLIPLAKKHSLSDLHEAIRRINELQQREFMIEYLMLDGVNDSQTAADELLSWLEGLNVHVNLIPFNSIDEAPHLSCSPKERIDSFAARLKAAGRKTTVRYSLGADVAAACGQLVRMENRRQEMM